MGTASTRPRPQPRPDVGQPGRARRSTRPKRLSRRDRRRAASMHEQILGFEARLLMRLPEPPTLLVDLADTGETVRIAPAQAAVGDEATRVDSTRPDPTRLDPTRLDPVCFDEDEWAALVTAVEADRVWPDDFRMICERKRSELEYRLTPARALGGAQPDPAERWSVAEVIGRLGARLRAVVDR